MLPLPSLLPPLYFLCHCPSSTQTDTKTETETDRRQSNPNHTPHPSQTNAKSHPSKLTTPFLPSQIPPALFSQCRMWKTGYMVWFDMQELGSGWWGWGCAWYGVVDFWWIWVYGLILCWCFVHGVDAKMQRCEDLGLVGRARGIRWVGMNKRTRWKLN